VKFEKPQHEGGEHNPLSEIWQDGTLFHLARRWAELEDGSRLDRLAGILEQGLVAPSYDPNNRILSDINIVVEGSERPYDSVVYLHRFDSGISARYVSPGIDTICIFVDPVLPILEPSDMGYAWPILCPDEIYVPGKVDLDRITGVAVSEDMADGVQTEFGPRLTELSIPLYIF